MPNINRKSINLGPKFKREKPFTYDDTNNGMMYYNSKQWKNLRNKYITDHPLCEECLIKGRSVEAQQVHHRKPFFWLSPKYRWYALLDESNLESLCIKCHNDKHMELNSLDEEGKERLIKIYENRLKMYYNL